MVGKPWVCFLRVLLRNDSEGFYEPNLESRSESLLQRTLSI